LSKTARRNKRSPTPPRRRVCAHADLDTARKLIADCGYHRRDEELAELDAVLAGARRFADLPPRVWSG
jgi:hypothetical protein